MANPVNTTHQPVTSPKNESLLSKNQSLSASDNSASFSNKITQVAAQSINCFCSISTSLFPDMNKWVVYIIAAPLYPLLFIYQIAQSILQPSPTESKVKNLSIAIKSPIHKHIENVHPLTPKFSAKSSSSLTNKAKSSPAHTSPPKSPLLPKPPKELLRLEMRRRNTGNSLASIAQPSPSHSASSFSLFSPIAGITTPLSQYYGTMTPTIGLYIEAWYIDGEDPLKALEEELEKGMDINIIDMEGNTRLHKAALANNLMIINWLLAHKADTSIRNQEKKTAFELSLIYGHLEVAKALFNFDPKQDFKFEYNDVTALCFKDDSTIKFKKDLFQSICQIHPRVAHAFFLICLEIEDIENASIALKHGAELEKPDVLNGFTPLAYSIHHGNITSVQFLISKGANLFAVDSQCFTLLGIALFNLNTDMAELLLEHIKDPSKYKTLDIDAATKKGLLPDYKEGKIIREDFVNEGHVTRFRLSENPLSFYLERCKQSVSKAVIDYGFVEKLCTFIDLKKPDFNDYTPINSIIRLCDGELFKLVQAKFPKIIKKEIVVLHNQHILIQLFITFNELQNFAIPEMRLDPHHERRQCIFNKLSQSLSVCMGLNEEDDKDNEKLYSRLLSTLNKGKISILTNKDQLRIDKKAYEIIQKTNIQDLCNTLLADLLIPVPAKSPVKQ